MWTGENGGFRKRRFSKTEVQRLCGRAKTEVFENDYVTGIGMSQLKKQNGCFLIRFRWCSVDGRKRYKNASVDEKLFIRFQEKENGGFRKRISVDRAQCLHYFLTLSIHFTSLFTKAKFSFAANVTESTCE